MNMISKVVSLFVFTALFAVSSYSQRLTYTLNENWRDGDWQPFIKNKLSFNSANLVDTIESSLYDAQQGAYITGSIILFTYNSDSTQQTELYKNWDTSTYTWNNSIRIQHTYNPQGKRVLSLMESWIGGNWQPSQRTTNTYNNANMLIKTLVEYYSSANSSYQPSEQQEYTLDSVGNAEKMIKSSWNNNTQNWDLYQQELTTFNALNLPIATLYQKWSNNAWVNSSKREVTYTNSNQVSRYLDLNWNAENSNYDSSVLFSSFYNINDKLLQTLTQVYDNANGQWLNNERMICVYESPTGFSEHEKLSIEAYPSPCQNELRVTLPETGNATIKIVDALGRILLTHDRAQQTNSIDVSALKSNTYFLLIQQNGKSGVKAFVKQ